MQKIVRGPLYYKIFEDITKSYTEKVSVRRGLESQNNGTVFKMKVVILFMYGTANRSEEDWH